MTRFTKIAVSVGLILFAGLIVFQLTYENASPAKTDLNGFLSMCSEGDVKKYVINDNRKTVNVYLKENSAYKYKKELKDLGQRAKKNGPQFKVKFVNSEFFRKEVNDFFLNNPKVERVPFDIINKE